jgi:hypothetical protein
VLQVSVGVCGGLGVAVPEDPLRGLERGTRLEQQAGRGVPEVVKSQLADLWPGPTAIPDIERPESASPACHPPTSGDAEDRE